MQSQSGMLDKVRALLAKASSTQFEDEAEALAAKAQELIAKYSIDESLLEAKRAEGHAPSFVEMSVEAPYANAKVILLGCIGRANDCEVVWNNDNQKATIIGFPHDIEAVELLFTSLLLQATSSMLSAGSRSDGLGRSRTKSFRQSFLIAYAHRVGQRLQEARDVAVEEKTVEVGPSVSLVLASKKEAVANVVEAQFPRLGTFNPSLSNGEGFRAGWSAGNAAQLDNQKNIRAG